MLLNFKMWFILQFRHFTDNWYNQTYDHPTYYTSHGWSSIPGLELNYTSTLAPPTTTIPQCPLMTSSINHSYYHPAARIASQATTSCYAATGNELRQAFTPLINPPAASVFSTPPYSQDACDEEKENVTATSKHTQKRDKKGRFTPYDALATRILSAWLERNQHHPYPSVDTVEVLARCCRLEPEQVRKWFSNKRARGKKVKRLDTTRVVSNLRL